MRSTKAFVIGAATAYLVARATRNRGRQDPFAESEEALTDVEVTFEDGIATVRGSVETSKQADALVEHVAALPGVNDVAAMLRVSGETRRAA